MPNDILISVTGWDPQGWKREFSTLMHERSVHDRVTDDNRSEIGYAVLWRHKYGLLSGLPELKALFSLGAGVDHILADPELPDLPLARIVDDNMTMRMSEYIVWQVLDQHRKGRQYRAQQSAGLWKELPQPVASEVTVGIMGYGTLGSDAGDILKRLGFNVIGWSRSPKQDTNVQIYCGADQQSEFLAAADILVVLLPLTPETQGVLNHTLLSKLKSDGPLGKPVLINAGRGGLQVEADIVRALDEGIIGSASLDVFETEPLPAASPLWARDDVQITPHAAAASEPAALAKLVASQIRTFEAGGSLNHLVDRKSGY
ncbi:MAG: glyoxylate/hydroxypyruvate reductase A [Pseudomonadota bacterium]